MQVIHDSTDTMLTLTNTKLNKDTALEFTLSECEILLKALPVCIPMLKTLALVTKELGKLEEDIKTNRKETAQL